MITDEPRRRTAVRVLPIDHDDRVLLLHGYDPAHPDEPYWFTVGGGLEPGETAVDAAVREMSEEVGIDIEPSALVGPSNESMIEFWFDSVRYEQRQTYYAVRVDSPKISFDGQDAIEHASIDGHAWWSETEIAQSEERIYLELSELRCAIGQLSSDKSA